MKDIINYYYNLNIDIIHEQPSCSSFEYNGEEFYFVYFNRDKEELEDISIIISELKFKNFKVHDFILNRNQELLTKVGNHYYILMKLNTKKNAVIDFTDICELTNKLKLSRKTSKLYRNNWAELWSKKIDYFEYQISELGKDKKMILDSFGYYLGMAENAISYVNKINKVIGISDNDNISLSHRRIFFPNIALNYYNPLSFVFDLEIRDISEYLKMHFFHNEDSLLDLQTFLKIRSLTPYSYHMLYARLLYPSYYFDVFDAIMNNNEDNEMVMQVIKKTKEYEKFLKDAYLEISKYTNLEKIDWVMKKEL